MLINGLIMAAIGTLSILLSEPTAKSNLKKDMYVCPLTCDITLHIVFYYMEESVLLVTKPLVDSIRHFIRDPSGAFSVCHDIFITLSHDVSYRYCVFLF